MPKTLETIIRETGLYGPVDEINFNNSAGRRVLTADIRILKEKDEPHKKCVINKSRNYNWNKERVYPRNRKTRKKTNKNVPITK